MPKKYVVIVDGVGTTSFLAPEFHKRGYTCIHVASPGEKAAYLRKSYRPGDFEIEINDEKDIAAIIQNLKARKLDIHGVIPGVESGVIPADEIAAALGLKQNDPSTSDVRRYKDKMANRLKDRGLAHISHLKSSDADAIVAWANENNHWPIVIKPTNGAGTEGLSICSKAEDVTGALTSINGKPSFLGHTYGDGEILAQPYIVGEEYCVNTVSVELASGEVVHRVTDIWTSVKMKLGDNIIYDHLELIASRGEAQDVLVSYMQDVLNAMEIKKGPTHAELILTAKGPVLIEVNMRIMGLGIPNIEQEKALVHSQISATADVYSDVNKFLENTQHPYQLKKHLVCVLHQVTQDNCVVNESATASVKALPHFAMHKFAATGPIAKTMDLINSPGWVLLIGDSREEVFASIGRLRQIETAQLFLPALQLSSSVTGLQTTSTGSHFIAIGASFIEPGSPMSAVVASGSNTNKKTTASRVLDSSFS